MTLNDLWPRLIWDIEETRQLSKEAKLKKCIRAAEAELDTKVYAHYPKLTVTDIKTLVVEDKWLTALSTTISGEMDRVSQVLTQGVKKLTERYESPLPKLTNRMAELEANVNGHLERMGFAWE